MGRKLAGWALAAGMVLPVLSLLSGGCRLGRPPPARRLDLPKGLKAVAGAQYAPLDGLAPDSKEAQERQKRAVEELGLPLEVENGIGMRFRLVPAGSFTMGSPEGEKGRDPDEGPQHKVRIARAFYVGKFEVTQGEWVRVMNHNPSEFQKASLRAPAETVSWDNCREFLKIMDEREGMPAGTYRLLTEAEWEYACRAGTSTALYNGPLTIKSGHNGPELDPIAWYGGNSGVQYEGALDSSR